MHGKTLVIGDLGQCKQLTNKTNVSRSNTVFGTLNYNAPEVVVNGKYSVKIDVW
jgi:serine/threonine protein kinase